MNAKSFVVLSSILFAIVALIQLVRFIMQWDIAIQSWHIPTWASAVAALVFGLLSLAGFSVWQQMRRHLG
jgi:hypothetical protein